MKLMLTLLLLSGKVMAFSTEANCELVDGIYQNSPNNLRDLKLSALTSDFKITSAKTLSFTLDGEEMKLHRKDLNVKKQTEMIFIEEGKEAGRAAYIHIGSTPRQIWRRGQFVATFVLTPGMKNAHVFELVQERKDVLTYNIHCIFDLNL